jgi:hypothetical protein
MYSSPSTYRRVRKNRAISLNPDEMADADLKQAVTKLASARTKQKLVKATARHLRSVQRRPERILRDFQHEPVRDVA